LSFIGALLKDVLVSLTFCLLELAGFGALLIMFGLELTYLLKLEVLTIFEFLLHALVKDEVVLGLDYHFHHLVYRFNYVLTHMEEDFITHIDKFWTGVRMEEGY
jgi:hypothetical protein